MRRTDEELQELVKQVKRGSEEAFGILLEEFIYLIYAVIVRQARGWPDSFEHLKCDVVRVFYELIMRYDPELTDSFRKYISSAIFWYVDNYKKQAFSLTLRSSTGDLESNKRSKRRPKISTKTSFWFDELQDVLKRKFPEHLKKKYPNYFKMFCLYYVEGYTQQQIAYECGCSQTLVSLTLTEVVRWLRRSRFCKKLFKGAYYANI
ncbi:MAG TPA: sigma-70 family RNA polymerase sigma factor [Methanofastidiosum sp.]|nr:sigma-70 family RNA polymerase sigma factor [Methanofastidiosum sp.]